MKLLTSFVNLILLTNLCKCHITRLPCKLYGDFSIRHENKYMTNTIVETFTDVEEDTCLIKCLLESTCDGYNYNVDKRCELVVSNINAVESTSGWKYVTTDISSDSNVGPLCESTSPCKHSKCMDTCIKPYYKCSQCEQLIGVYNEGAAITINLKFTNTNTFLATYYYGVRQIITTGADCTNIRFGTLIITLIDLCTLRFSNSVIWRKQNCVC